MAELTLWRWEKYAPALGNNKEQERPFYLRVKAGLSKVELESYRARLAAMPTEDFGDPAKLAEAFAQVVAMGEEPLVVAGERFETLADYFRLLVSQSGADLYWELTGAIAWHNSYTGARVNFSERSSGGNAFTARAAPQTAAASPGSRTSNAVG